ncbi:MAG: homoserine kinase [Methylococcaceae bacterium]|nr:homoserine kinase [Methylococcaceae bacterium]MDZ4156285.1 homoserine kinase [Methylococcales bacterium]MDP2393403.1 homoserine kinase [Methylococcaceae bacterium]MDP3019890.1 homoserine kinase [Methylococcaceae bacterium]MDP3388703.1 homoserine kinase [Methylococcaceae bacterium]
MSVYTSITHAQLEDFFAGYALGDIVSFEGIADGIDNTNYRVKTTCGEVVLTLFEAMSESELDHIIGLLAHLSAHKLPCPMPQADHQGRLLRRLSNKPAAVFNHLSGAAVSSPSIAQCRAVGEQLARLHLCTQQLQLPLENSNDVSWCQTVFSHISGYLSVVDAELIVDELKFQAQCSWSGLPSGVIHGDLFKDNVLFDGDRLSGMLDFYSACTGPLLLDVAITANDWCCENGTVNPDKFNAIIAAYQRLRPWQDDELLMWSTALRAAALRFWLSRLQHQIYPRSGIITQQKDPLVFRRILQQHRQPQAVFKPVPKPDLTNANTFITRRTA